MYPKLAYSRIKYYNYKRLKKKEKICVSVLFSQKSEGKFGCSIFT